MSVEEEFDWRIWGVTTLTKEYTPAGPVGMSYKAGTPVYPAVVTRDRASGETIGFALPSPAKLSISIAINASHIAERLRKAITYAPTFNSCGRGKHVKPETLKQLYDFFEFCMISVTFSYQALEAYSNCIIADQLKGAISLRMNKKIKQFNSKQILEGSISTDTKLGTILPKILNVDPPETNNNSVWQNYLELKRVRNTTIHMKLSDATSGVNIDKETLLYEFFRADIGVFPKYALDMIDSFETNRTNRYWIDQARYLLESGAS